MTTDTFDPLGALQRILADAMAGRIMAGPPCSVFLHPDDAAQLEALPMADNPQFNAVLGEMADLHDRKNHDYAEDNNPYSNFEYAAAHAGVTVQQVFDVMLGIKQARLRQLTVKDAINESIRDSMIDRAVYAALAVAYYDAQAAQGTPPQPSLFAGTLEKVTALATRATLNPNRNLYCVPAPPDHIEGAEFRSEGD